MRRALAGSGIRVLDNEAVQAGPLVIGGLDDAFTGHNRDAATYAAMRRLPGARILLSHSPDPFATLPARHRPDARRPYPLRADPAAALIGAL